MVIYTIFHHPCCNEKSQWACHEARNRACIRPLGGPAMRTCNGSLFVHPDGPAMGLQWACNGATLGPPWGLQWVTAMGLQWEKRFLQWACNGLAMHLQWVCNSILVGPQWAYVTFLMHFEKGEGTPLQAHCDPIAGMALRKQTPYPVAHCRSHSGPAGTPSHAHRELVASPFACPLRAHCGSITGPLRAPNRAQATLQDRCQAVAGPFTSVRHTNYNLPQPSSFRYQITYLCPIDLLHHVGASPRS
jgi:hypothetical protein